MLQTNQAASVMNIENASKAFVIPLHKGAYKFWIEQGVEEQGSGTRHASGLEFV